VKVLDVSDPSLINRPPDKTIILMSNGTFVESGHIVKNVHLNLYIQEKNNKFGPYSILTAYVETNKGVIEMTYDEGYRGDNALEEAAAFLTSHLGISALILRSIVQFEILGNCV
jgi:hypothetical protein